MAVWGSALTADGRTYYFKRASGETTWTKPEDFDGDDAPPAAPAGGGHWVEAKSGDKAYYYHTGTKKTQWEKPSGYDEQQQQRNQPPQQNGRPDFVAGGGSRGFSGTHQDFRGRGTSDDRGHGLPQKPAFDGPPRGPSGGGGGALPWENRQDSMGGGGGGGFRGPMPAKTDEPEYATSQAAEEAFFKMLRRFNITPDTGWQDALRLVIRDREYRAIKDPQERKLAFEKYQNELQAQEKIREKERKERVREEFRRMLSTHDEIEHYTRWETARPMLEREAVFKSAGDEDERRRIFDEYILELKKKHAEDEAVARKQAIQELDKMLQVLIIDPDTRWVDAEDKIVSNERFVSEDLFKDLHKLDIFLAYENHMKALERVANDAIQSEKQSKKRRFRKARDAYKSMLEEKLHGGKIRAGTKWQDFFPLVKDDERLRNYLATPGSTPQDLFWDVVEEEERKLRAKRNDALDVLEEQRWEMTTETSLDEFATLLKSHPRTALFQEHDISLIFERLLEKVKRRAEDSKFEAERHTKSAVDALRSALKRLTPPIKLGESFEEVSKRLSGLREYESASEDVRIRAYDKFISRLREREDERPRRDRDRDHSREAARGAPRRDERERERDRRHRTRTPEVDAYEADRRKAQADRERQYRKASFGLTPPPRDRRALDDRYEDRRRPDPRDTYERERRERELERERTYMSRADPRDKGKTLDYGDEDMVGSRPPSVRKRRDSDDGARVSKRQRDGKEPEGVLKDEEPALQSGSEEGEIEEV